MINFESFFWNLPPAIRRNIYKLLKPKRFKRYQKNNVSISKNGYTFKRFHELRCIFVHIPKTGGISLSNTIFGNMAGGHVPIKSYQLFLEKNQFEEYFKFTIVRNPWDRVVSAYLFLKKGGLGGPDKKWAEKNLSDVNSFDEFVKKYLPKKKIHNFTHFRPQYKYFADWNSKIMVDYIGHFENLGESLSYISNKLGIEEVQLKKENVNKERAHYRSYYTEETSKIVGKVYKKDIELLGYEF